MASPVAARECHSDPFKVLLRTGNEVLIPQSWALLVDSLVMHTRESILSFYEKRTNPTAGTAAPAG